LCGAKAVKDWMPGRRRRSPGAAQKEAPHLRGIFRTTTSFSGAIDYVLKFDIQQQ
jgi:hypothetical protein